MDRSCQTGVLALSCNTDLVFPPPTASELTYEKLDDKRARPPGKLQPVSAWPAFRPRLDRIDPSYQS